MRFSLSLRRSCIFIYRRVDPLGPYLSFHGHKGNAGRGKASKDVVEGGEGRLRGTDHALSPTLAPHVTMRVLQSYNTYAVMHIRTDIRLNASLSL